ncbi:MAG TPA: hypothetical protein VJL90_12160 [Pseudorhodoplanes sp.]|nr:hypothetical protein [Pseudorhodoplanes sp.]
MKTAIALLAIALGAAIPSSGANASDKNQDPALGALSHSEDFSAARKRRHVYVYPDQYGYYPGYYPSYARAYAADPSWQSPELRRLRALNRCVIDLGYGRWENCN